MGINWYMSDFEIKQMFNEAKSKTEIVQILADLNCVTHKVMFGKLVELGVKKQRIKPANVCKNARPYTEKDDSIIIAMLNTKFERKIIMQRLNRSKSSLNHHIEWLRDNGLWNKEESL